MSRSMALLAFQPCVITLIHAGPFYSNYSCHKNAFISSTKSIQQLSKESIIESTEKNIIRNKRSTQVNRLIDNSIVIVVPIHFGDDISCSTSMHYASDSELDIAVLWIGFVDRPTVGRSTVKNNLLALNKVDGTSNFIRTNFPEEVFALSKQ